MRALRRALRLRPARRRLLDYLQHAIGRLVLHEFTVGVIDPEALITHAGPLRPEELLTQPLQSVVGVGVAP